MSQTASAYLPHTVDHCWQAFTDIDLLPAWVPGLRRARVVTRNPEGRASEVSFEYGETLIYSLVYQYDAQREVSWEPRVGRRDGVAGRATFEVEGEGCRFSYQVHPALPNHARERLDESPERIVAAFVGLLARGPR